MRSRKSPGVAFLGLALSIVLSLLTTARLASAAPIFINNPDYNGDVSGWSALNPASFGYDGLVNSPGSPGGSMYWGDNATAGPYWIYQTLTATASASNFYTLSVWLYNDRNTLVGTGGNYKIELFTADSGETPATATLIGSSAPILPSTIPLNGWSQFSIDVDGATIPIGELGKSLMIAAEIPQHTLWGYADQWSLNAYVPEPASLSGLLLVSAMFISRRRQRA